MISKWAIPSAIAVMLLPIISGCLNAPEKETDTILLYGFSVKGEVFDKAIIPAFKEYYRNLTGRSIEFQTSYAGSGEITGQVINGAPAEVMILSTEWDALSIKKAGLTTTDWRTFEYNGTVSTSPWVILVRNESGKTPNPKGIHDFPDLARSDVKIVHADPLTSGGACWSLFAIYGSEMRKTTLTEGRPNETKAQALLKEIVQNHVESWQSSARKALSQFTLGYGDALITYENDALLAKAQGQRFDIIYPPCTISSEHKVIMVDENIASEERDACEKFVDFLSTPEVQRYMVEYNFHAPDESLNGDFPEIEDPFLVSYLGGWESAHEKIIDGYFTEYKGE